VKHFVQRGIVLLGASAIALGLASPAFAGGPEAARDSVVQRQAADVSNSTEQKAVAFAPAVQVAPAANVAVLSLGGQSIKQANSNSSEAQAGNWNSTSQSVTQRQAAAVADGHGKHGRKVGKHDGKFKHHPKRIKHGHKAKKGHKVVKHRKGKVHPKPIKHGRKHARHDCKPVRHERKHGKHPRERGDSVSQRQSADASNSTEQKAVAIAPALQVAPALNLSVLSFGGQSIHQANSNSARAGASNVNSTDQEVSQSQLGDA
jgi:hypothetical protein